MTLLRYTLSIALLVASCMSCSSRHENRRTSSYSRHFQEENYGDRFFAKIQKAAPDWMVAQIEEDLACLGNRKITLEALNATDAAIQTPERVERYRIVDNRLYFLKTRKVHGFEQSERIEKALGALTELTKLPNMDFIVNLEDGTEAPFYLTENPEMQAPILGWAKLKTTPYLLLIPDDRSLSTIWVRDLRKMAHGKLKKNTPWKEKKPIAFWRGAQTELLHRLNLCKLSLQFPDRLDAGLTALWLHISPEFEPYLKSHASYEDHMEYKYLPVMDGVMCSYPGYQWRLFSGSLALKQESDQIQWFYRELKPYTHYLPIANDLSNLFEQMHWAEQNDALCEKIALQAKDFAFSHLMFDDVYHYLYLALCHYAERLDPSFEDDLKTTSSNPNWSLVTHPKYKN